MSVSRRMSSDFEFEEMHGDEEEIKHDQSLKSGEIIQHRRSSMLQRDLNDIEEEIMDSHTENDIASFPQNRPAPP